MLREMYITYNACLNQAHLRGDENPDQCKKFMNKKTCEFIVGEFYYMPYRLISSFITSYAVYFFEQLFSWASWGCQKPGGGSIPGCKPVRLIDILYEVAAFFEVYDNINAIVDNPLFNGGFGDDDSDKSSDEKRKEVESQISDDCDDLEGCGSKYN